MLNVNRKYFKIWLDFIRANSDNRFSFYNSDHPTPIHSLDTFLPVDFKQALLDLGFDELKDCLSVGIDVHPGEELQLTLKVTGVWNKVRDADEMLDLLLTSPGNDLVWAFIEYLSEDPDIRNLPKKGSFELKRWGKVSYEIEGVVLRLTQGDGIYSYVKGRKSTTNIHLLMGFVMYLLEIVEGSYNEPNI